MMLDAVLDKFRNLERHVMMTHFTEKKYYKKKFDSWQNVLKETQYFNLDVYLPYEPLCLSVCWLVCQLVDQSVYHDIQKL